MCGRMATAPFPHRYVVSVSNHDLAAPPRANIQGGAPPQFGGTDQVWSPEELLVGAVVLCLETTFDAFARRAGLEVLDWHAVGTATLDKAQGGPAFTSIVIDVEVSTGAGQEARAEEIVQTAERHCIISRALSVPVHVNVIAKAGAPGARPSDLDRSTAFF